MIKKVLSGFLALSIFSASATFAEIKLPQNAFLKKGYNNSTVVSLQKRLTELGYFSVSATGYYGNITKGAVKNFQSDFGLTADGIVGRQTISKLNSAYVENDQPEAAQAKAPEVKVATSKSGYNTSTQSWTWFGKVNSFMPNGSTFEFLDIYSGKTISAKRTYGTNHADIETLTAADTASLKSALGGSWTWARRPVIVFFNGYALPASLAPYPHAGNENAPATKYTSWRSGGYGGGANLDAVKGNNMSGVLDLHFLSSKTHGSNRVEPKHQATIKEAGSYLKSNIK